jgi:hypothetical protein
VRSTSASTGNWGGVTAGSAQGGRGVVVGDPGRVRIGQAVAQRPGRDDAHTPPSAAGGHAVVLRLGGVVEFHVAHEVPVVDGTTSTVTTAPVSPTRTETRHVGRERVERLMREADLAGIWLSAIHEVFSRRHRHRLRGRARQLPHAASPSTRSRSTRSHFEKGRTA